MVVVLLHWLFLTILRKNIDPSFDQRNNSVLHVVLIQRVSNREVIPRAYSVKDVVKVDRLIMASADKQFRSRKSFPATSSTSREVNEPKIFNIDGSLNIPKDLIEQIEQDLPKPKFRPTPPLASTIMQRPRIIKLRQTLFEPYWVGANETLFAEFGRQHLIKERTFKTGSGARIGCTWMVVLLACGDVPPPAWKAPTRWQPRQSEADE